MVGIISLLNFNQQMTVTLFILMHDFVSMMVIKGYMF